MKSTLIRQDNRHRTRKAATRQCDGGCARTGWYGARLNRLQRQRNRLRHCQSAREEEGHRKAQNSDLQARSNSLHETDDCNTGCAMIAHAVTAEIHGKHSFQAMVLFILARVVPGSGDPGMWPTGAAPKSPCPRIHRKEQFMSRLSRWA